MTNKATFDNIPKVSLGTDSDMFLVRQNGEAVSQKRKELSASLGNASWTNTVDYLTGSEVIYNNKRYRALQDNGVSFGNIRTPDNYPSIWLDLQDALNNKYSPENKPSANDVQALPVIGGSLTGNLEISTSDFAKLSILASSNKDVVISMLEKDDSQINNGFDIRYDGSSSNELQIEAITNHNRIKAFAINQTNGNLTLKGELHTTEGDAHIYTEGTNAKIYTTGAVGKISTEGTYADIHTSGEYGYIYTDGKTGHIFTNGVNANIYTNGTNAKIYTKGSSADIYTELGEIKEQGQRVYSPNNKPTAGDFILDDGSNVQDKISSLLDEIDALKLRLDALE